MEHNQSGIAKEYCMNCETVLLEAAPYCYSCGQSVKESRLSVWAIVSEAITNFFNLDGRVFRTVRYLYSPSKLTKAFVAGKRRQFMNPARIFLFSLIVLVSILLSSMSTGGLNELTGSSFREVALAEQKIEWDTLLNDIRTPDNKQLLQQIQDSLYGDIHIDSLVVDTDVTVFGVSIDKYNIRQKDMLELSGDELLDKYEVTGMGDRIFVKQYQKIANNPAGGISYVVKNLPWVLLVLIFLMAAFMKLLYIRGGYYYIEHLVLMLYSHSLLCISLVSLFAIGFFAGGSTLFLVSAKVLVLLLLGVQYLSLKRYYDQGWFKTLVKQIVINSAYFILFIMVATIGTLISFFLF